ncbi:enoyl-CoA hydratase/isomerase family protein [Paraburkholderia xenovorans LB400]|uniref:Enoyl-CoA hydratase/isomerase n=1 Tax=Paraburkholderia xenovorans (strain LB400) TaxID=266265 RepID=Q13GP2_PARXL|nr:enoyl-CoA hydratase/isomerase family protein [Paraburkholderia xenovorans]ABE36747.1 Putative enoyl-CoA hydratase/isomerase [Paraburkholderia xenovorans LB400]AIP35125.1 enoyl-CoA hydratase/isomerase family protein [Paraburkholderia xenovorans LB400]
MALPDSGVERSADGALLIEVIDNVLRLTLNRPSHRNAISAAMFRAIVDAVAASANDPRVRVIEIRSALTAMFCAGADVASLSDPAPDALTVGFRHLEDCVAALRDSPRPVVTVVTGDCLGAGCSIAAASDVVIASEDARFCLPEIRLDLAPVLAVAALHRVVQPRRLALWAATGRLFSAREAFEGGLVSEVHPLAAAEAAAVTAVAELSRPSSFTLDRLKRTLALLANSHAPDEAQLFELMLSSATHPATQAAVAAFLARRQNKPDNRAA